MHLVRGTCLCLSQLGGWRFRQVKQHARDPRPSITFKVLHLPVHSRSQPATAKAFQRRMQVNDAGDLLCLSSYILMVLPSSKKTFVMVRDHHSN